jgi:hypothetical protein
MFPSLEEEKSKIPRGALDLGRGYVLLRTKDRYLYKLSGHELAAVKRADIQYPTGSVQMGKTQTSQWSNSLICMERKFEAFDKGLNG